MCYPSNLQPHCRLKDSEKMLHDGTILWEWTDISFLWFKLLEVFDFLWIGLLRYEIHQRDCCQCWIQIRRVCIGMCFALCWVFLNCFDNLIKENWEAISEFFWYPWVGIGNYHEHHNAIWSQFASYNARGWRHILTYLI